MGGLVWIKEHADELNIGADHIAIGGISGGGGLTMALAPNAAISISQVGEYVRVFRERMY